MTRTRTLANCVNTPMQRHAVYHHTGPGMAKTDFRGSWQEAMDWIAAARAGGDRTNYFMRSI